MSERFGIVRVALQLALVMAIPGTVMAGSVGSAASAVSAASTLPAATTVQHRQQASLQPPHGAARPLVAVSGVSGQSSPLFAAESRPLVPVRKAKQLYALLLSSFGMLGVIALHRLTDIAPPDRYRLGDAS